MYAVVNFLDTREVEVVPLVWLFNKKKKCYWPHFTDAKRKKAVKNQLKPEKTWAKYNVKVMKIYGEDLFTSRLGILHVQTLEILYIF